MPSSQTENDESALGASGSKGKGKKEFKQAASYSREVETTTVLIVNTCNVCGEDLGNIACHTHERRTKIDIVFEKVVEHVDVEIKGCPSCPAKVTAPFPGDMYGPLQYGNGLKASAINILFCQMVALNRVQKCVTAMIGQTVSEATLLKFIVLLHGPWTIGNEMP